MNPTDEQRAAVEAGPESLLLAAGAGSGKTRVMVERFVRAVREEELDVGAILAITFTEKAADELRARVRARFAELGDPAAARATEGAAISTIHGFCARLLRTEALAAGLDPSFAVLDEAAAERLAHEAFDSALEELVAERGDPMVELVAAYGAPRLRGAVLDAHAKLRSLGHEAPRLPAPAVRAPVEPARRGLLAAARAAAAEVGAAPGNGTRVEQALDALDRAAERAGGGVPWPGELGDLGVPPRNGAKALAGPACARYRVALEAWRAACADHHAARACALIDELLAAHDARYAALKRTRSGLDFEDLELGARRLLAERPEIRTRWSERYARVMVDEFQDTNRLQLELLDLLAGDRLCTVGDERQSIYGFRHADVELFRARRNRLAARGRALALRDTFRAAPELVTAINAAFAAIFDDGFVALRAARTEPAPGAGPPVEALITDKDGWEETAELAPAASRETPRWRVAEARLLARRVRALIDVGEHRPRDIVVLLRATTDLDVFERALEDERVGTYVVGGRGYWGQRQVADLLAYLALVANPRDEPRLYEVLASPLVGASSDALVILADGARAARRHPWWALAEALRDGGDGSGGLAERLPTDDRPRLAAFVARLDADRADAPRRPLEALIDRALRASGYDLAVLRMPGGERRLANVRKLMRMARAYEAEEGRDLRGFLDYAARLAGDELAAAREAEAPVADESLDAVRLMTIHRAKGLEFPVVCVADLGRTPRDDHGLLRLDAEGRVGLKVAGLDGGPPCPALAWKEIDARATAAADREEERLLYVAMTRAQERLIISGSVPCGRWPQRKHGCEPLAWVAPALLGDVVGRFATGAPTGVVEREHGGGRARVAYAYQGAAAAAEAGPGVAPADVPAAFPAAPAAAADASAAPPAAPTAASDVPGAPPVVAPGAPAAASADVAAPPAVDHLSYSGLQSYASCSYRFYLERILRLPAAAGARDDAAHDRAAAGHDGHTGHDGATGHDGHTGPDGHGLAPVDRGTIAHALLEELDFARPCAPSVEQVLAAAAATRSRPTDEEAQEVAALVTGFGASPLCRRLAAARDARREEPFSYWLAVPETAAGGVVVTGVVDAIAFEADGRTLVVDYKSDRLEGREPERVVESAYAVQRLVYALAALRAGAMDVEVVHCFLERPHAAVGARFGAQEAAALAASLRELATGALTGRFPVTPAPDRDRCGGCPGRGGLCSWPWEATTGAPADEIADAAA